MADNLKINFVRKAESHGVAIEDGNSKLANQLHKELMSIYATLKTERRLDEIRDILKDENEESVILWAATCLLKDDSKLAMPILIELQASPRIIGVSASMTIEMWEKGH